MSLATFLSKNQDPDYVNFAFVISQTSIGEEHWKNLYNLYKGGLGNSRYKSFVDYLSDVKWKWERFNGFEQIFIRDRRIPALWEYFGYNKMSCMEDRKEFLARILEHTIGFTIISAEQCKQYQQAMKDGIKGKIKVIETGICPIELEHAKKYNMGQLDKPPPFFPGDRNDMVFVTA